VRQCREDDGPDKSESEFSQEDRYSVSDMTPDMVHFGSIPESVVSEEIENVRRIIDSELTGSHDAQTLRSLLKVCDNAMKQYRRSRPEASTEGKRRAREILEGKKDETGKRTGRGRIPCHPILRDVEYKRMLAHGTNTYQINELRQRDEFLQSLSNFRPKETVFEAFATGGGKEIGVLSHIDKGRTTQATKKHDTSLALSAMKGMRRQMKIARGKSAALVVAGSSEEPMSESVNVVSFIPDYSGNVHDPVDEMNVEFHDSKETEQRSKRRISKALRKKLRKEPHEQTNSLDPKVIDEKTKRKRGVDFRDRAYYIDQNMTSDLDVALRSHEIEKAMQPSSSGAKDSLSSAMRLEEAILDIVGDENVDLVQRHRINRWDKSKRKYIQTTIGSEISGGSKSKKVRLESGQHLKQDKMKLGELYEKWQKKTNKSIGRVGIFDDGHNNGNTFQERSSGKFDNHEVKKRSKDADSMKTAIQIKKQREAEKKMQLKNMKRTDRRRFEAKIRVERNKRSAEKVKMKQRVYSKGTRR
jgi:ATP-dependent RNA helicase DDX54/DBP10